MFLLVALPSRRLSHNWRNTVHSLDISDDGIGHLGGSINGGTQKWLVEMVYNGQSPFLMDNPFVWFKMENPIKTS